MFINLNDVNTFVDIITFVLYHLPPGVTTVHN